LEGTDRTFEGQTLSLQQVSRRAAAVPHDSREHDRAIDLASAPAARGRSGGFENAPQVG